MSEVIYIKETKEFLTEFGVVIKEKDLSKAEITELKSNCSTVNKLFGNVESSAKIIRG